MNKILITLSLLLFGCTTEPEEDTTPPSVTITQPINGATLNALTTIKANAIDNEGVKNVVFYVDGDGDGVGGDCADVYEYCSDQAPDWVSDLCGDCDNDDADAIDEDCFGVCGGVAVLDDCNVCDGGNADDLGCGCFEPAPQVECWNDIFVCDESECPDDTGGEITDGCDLPSNNIYITPEGAVLYNSTDAIGGFQFNLDGATASAAGGGDAAAAGFVVQGSTTILGFSFTGSSIPAGCGTLTELTVDGPPSGLSSIVISSTSGTALDFTYYEGGGGSEDIEGCTDSSACNYDSAATVDDNSCEYAEENFDCDGNCLVDVDCLGECGGTAVEDCLGECGGQALLDECGVCDGDNSSCSGCTDETALNYDSDATSNDGSCIFIEGQC